MNLFRKWWLEIKGVHFHYWSEFKKQEGDLIFTCRECRCGLEQVQHIHSREWRDVKTPWTWEWELEKYSASERTQT